MSSPMPLPAQPNQMRCADSDRELVADVLNAAFAEGRITHDEHTERMEALWQARTFGELTPLTDDLMPSGQTHLLPTPAAGQGTGLVVDPPQPQPGRGQHRVRDGRREAPGPLAAAASHHRSGADG